MTDDDGKLYQIRGGRLVEVKHVPDPEPAPVPPPQERLIPVTKWNEFHPWPPVGGLRHLILHRKTNGFESCVRKIGRSVLIDERAFLEWAKSASRQKTGAA